MGFLYLQNELKLQTAVVSLIEGQDCAEFFQPLSTRCDLLGRSMQRRFYMVQGDAWRSTGWMREDLGGPEKQGVTWWLWKLLHRALTTNVLILQVPPSTMAPMWLKSLHGVKQGELAALIHPPEDGIQPGFRWWVCVDLHHHAGISLDDGALVPSIALLGVWVWLQFSSQGGRCSVLCLSNGFFKMMVPHRRGHPTTSTFSKWW